MALGGKVKKWIDDLLNQTGEIQLLGAEKIVQLGENYFYDHKVDTVYKNEVIDRLFEIMRMDPPPIVAQACIRLGYEFRIYNDKTEFILHKGMETDDAVMQAAAIYGTSFFGTAAKSLAEPIACLYTSKSRDVRFKIGWTLRKIGAWSAGIRAALLTLSNDDDSSVRGYAIESLGVLAAAGDRDIVDSFEKALNHQDGFVRSAAVRASARIDQTEKRLLKKIIQIARFDKFDTIQYEAAMAIVDYGAGDDGIKWAKEIFKRNPDNTPTQDYLQRIAHIPDPPWWKTLFN